MSRHDRNAHLSRRRSAKIILSISVTLLAGGLVSAQQSPSHQHRHFAEKMGRAKRNTLADLTSPGDPGKADALIDKISGEYRASFENMDISGGRFTSTDTLTIERLSKTSIRYSVSLNFFNGHTCSRSGVAEYKQNGSFVSHARTPMGECYFELIPTEKGISFWDPTLVCRQVSCGMRGGYDNEGFTFAQKQSSHDGIHHHDRKD
jgi:hypothetical protein